jgi:hypothetical protein
MHVSTRSHDSSLTFFSHAYDVLYIAMLKMPMMLYDVKSCYPIPRTSTANRFILGSLNLISNPTNFEILGTKWEP